MAMPLGVAVAEVLEAGSFTLEVTDGDGCGSAGSGAGAIPEVPPPALPPLIALALTSGPLLLSGEEGSVVSSPVVGG